MIISINLAISIMCQDGPIPFWGGWSSKLRCGSTPLVKFSYLFQGLPDTVLGSQFAYSKRIPQLCETMLIKEITKRLDWDADQTRALHLLLNSLRIDRVGRPMLVFSERLANVISSELRADRMKYTVTENQYFIDTVLLYYAEFQNMHLRKRHIQELERSHNPYVKSVVANLEYVSKRLIVTHYSPAGSRPLELVR